MFKTKRGIAKEVEQIKEVLMPSKVVILRMWRPGDPSSDTHNVKLPPDYPPHDKCEQEIIAKGLAEHKRVIILPLKYEDRLTKVEAEKE